MARPKRKPSGRPKGAVNKKSMVDREAIISSGDTPLDVMIENMRATTDEISIIQDQLDEFVAFAKKTKMPDGDRIKMVGSFLKEIRELRGLSNKYAADAAPYVHSKLSSVDIGNAGGAPFQVVLSKEDQGVM